jgi:DNA-binding response OmpR family regulator
MKKILLVDDEWGFSFLVKNNLELVGDYQVIRAWSGEQGIEIAKKESPDAILMDITLPQMDGFEALGRLKKDRKTRSIPVIMLTARDDDEARFKAMHLRNDGYITKPFEIAELEEKLDGALQR